MNVPNDRRYTKDHEWILLEGSHARIGVTDYAQEALGDVVFVSLPQEGRLLAAGEVLGELESTKSVAEVYAPVSGVVTAVNTALGDTPELVNQDPYGSGWLVVLSEPGSMDELLEAPAYRRLIG